MFLHVPRSGSGMGTCAHRPLATARAACPWRSSHTVFACFGGSRRDGQAASGGAGSVCSPALGGPGRGSSWLVSRTYYPLSHFPGDTVTGLTLPPFPSGQALARQSCRVSVNHQGRGLRDRRLPRRCRPSRGSPRGLRSAGPWAAVPRRTQRDGCAHAAGERGSSLLSSQGPHF